MRYTVFDHSNALEYLEKEYNILLVSNHQDAAIIVAERTKSLNHYIKLYGKSKKYLIWTREPRFNTCFYPVKKSFFWQPEIHIMNVYTGDVFCDNYYENSYRLVIDQFLELLTNEKITNFNTRKIAFLATNQQGKTELIKDGQDIDLLSLRNQIAVRGHQLGKIDVYGRGWPEGVSAEDSRYNNRVSRKGEILENYHFNLCFENTNFPYYCTEKIWESIRFGCLPIYYGEGNCIYEDFPKYSFLDYSELGNPDLLFDYIDNISVDEFIERMNKCIKTFNQAHEKISNYSSRTAVINPGMIERIARKMRSIITQ